MKRTQLVRNQRSQASAPSRVPSPTARQATVSATSQREHAGKQFSAVIWIVAAWLIGTLVSELNVIGAEPSSKTSTTGSAIAYESTLDRWAAQETEFAITHSGIMAFDRLQRDSRLRHLLVAIIGEETATSPIKDHRTQDSTNAIANSDSEIVQSAPPQEPSSAAIDQSPDNEDPTAASSDSPKIASNDDVGSKRTERPEDSVAETIPADSDSNVEVAFEQSIETSSEDENTPEQSQTQLAWKAFPEGSIPGLVELVVHSFNELMTPVHVRPLASEEAVVTVADNALDAESSIMFVETDTQESPTVDVVVQPAIIERVVVDRARDQHGSDQSMVEQRTTDQSFVDQPVGSDTDARADAVFETPFHGAQIVRSRPQLLRVPTHSVMLPAPREESTAVRDHTSATAPMQPETRLAAKWPFERAKPAPSSGVALNVDNADVRTVFEMLARGYQMNILVAPEVEGVVTANVDGLSPEQTLKGIVKMCGLNMQQDGEMIYIYSSDKIPSEARQLRVFPLDFARAATLEPTVQGLLSPVGNAYPTTLDAQDNLQTEESIVVVDIPSVIAQVEDYILQADQAPRQVMIEARVLEVELSDDMMHGVNFDVFSRRLNLKVRAHGLADPIVSTTNPLFFAQIEGGELNGLLEFIETTTDAKTLASPRVQVINGQNARIQVGQQLGFTVATVTQTSTIQDVQFLETGVVLSVTPTISRDGRILMQVKPEVSNGEINPDTLLPEEETREVETSVLLDNHEGVVIGGLIQEKDRTVIKKLPWLGDVKHIGKLFQRREAIRSRTEIIVALVPHIIDHGVQDERSIVDYERTETPLLQGVLQRTCRPWEPRLPDRAGEEKHMDVNSLNRKLP